MLKPRIVSCLLFAAVQPAAAEGVSLTVSPIHFILPMGELTAEVRVADRVGVAVVLGAGAIREEVTDAKVGVFEGGASLRYYVTGSFRKGIQLGGEALYIHASTDDTSTMSTVAAEGLGLSPFVGYKWTHRSGLTFDGQLGATFIALRASDSTNDAKIGPMLNLNLGYSF
jgi:hypothetical protein